VDGSFVITISCVPLGASLIGTTFSLVDTTFSSTLLLLLGLVLPPSLLLLWLPTFRADVVGRASDNRREGSSVETVPPDTSGHAKLVLLS
jgi:hypothetical protein